MKVALITDGIWPYVLGGMQKHSFYLCKYLAQKKVEVDLYHFNSSHYNILELEFFSDEEKKYIRSHVLDFPIGISFPGHYIHKSYKYSRLIFKTIKDKLHEFDFIYTKGFSGWYLISQKKAKKINCSQIGVNFHGYEMFQKPPSTKTWLQQILFLRLPVRSISRRADVVFSYGGKITGIIKSLGVEETKIFVLPSGVEESYLVDKPKETNKIIRFLFLGRYERRKGIEELNLAIENIFKSADLPTAEFHFIGPIPENKKIDQHQVVYHGEIRDKQKLTKIIASCDILICPSWSEGMPNVILEAMACGLAIVATNVGATSVLVSQKTGWLLNSPSPREIELTIRNILSLLPSDITSKKNEALRLIKDNFVWEKLVTRFYDNILSERTQRTKPN